MARALVRVRRALRDIASYFHMHRRALLEFESLREAAQRDGRSQL